MYDYYGIDRFLGLPEKEKLIREFSRQSNIRITGISRNIVMRRSHKKKQNVNNMNVEGLIEEKLTDIINIINNVEDQSVRKKLFPIKKEIERILYKIKMGIY